MIANIEEIKEFRDDGSLRYECTIAYLSPQSEHLYDKRVGRKGNCFIRINHATKYRQDGVIEWRHIYNDKGVIIGAESGSLASNQLKLAL